MATKKTDLRKISENIPKIPESPKRDIGKEIAGLKQEISNLCFTIGDKYYGIRLFEQEIPQLHEQIDALRDKLANLEKENGPQNPK